MNMVEMSRSVSNSTAEHPLWYPVRVLHHRQSAKSGQQGMLDHQVATSNRTETLHLSRPFGGLLHVAVADFSVLKYLSFLLSHFMLFSRTAVITFPCPYTH